MPSLFSVLRFATIIVVSMLIPLPAAAQFNGAIQGVVTDNTSAMVPGATVTVTNVATGVSRDVDTRGESTGW